MGKEKITKNVVPTCYTISLSIFDFVPVIVFLIFSIIFYLLLDNVFVLIGFAILSISFLLRAIWKIIVVIKKKNVWPLFAQSQIVIPLGIVLFVIGFFVAIFTLDDDTIKLLNKASKIVVPFPIIITLIGLIFNIVASIASKGLDPNSTKAQWVKTICNTIALLLYLSVMIILYENYLNLL